MDSKDIQKAIFSYSTEGARKHVELIIFLIGKLGTITKELLVENALKELSCKKNKQKQKKYYLDKRIKKFIEEDLIKQTTQQGKYAYQLSEKGWLKYKQLTAEKGLKENNKKKWDGKWRIVTFDIQETKRLRRDQLRKELKAHGFLQLQRSVWVYPFECREYIMLLKANSNTITNARYIEADYIDEDFDLRTEFGITK